MGTSFSRIGSTTVMDVPCMRFCLVAVGLRVLALVVDRRAGSRAEWAMLPETEVRAEETRRGAVASDVVVMVFAGG